MVGWSATEERRLVVKPAGMLSISDGLVASLFSGAFVTANAYSELRRHRRLVDCEVDAEMLAESTEALVETYETGLVHEVGCFR